MTQNCDRIGWDRLEQRELLERRGIQKIDVLNL